jgi:hypothetical protein
LPDLDLNICRGDSLLATEESSIDAPSSGRGIQGVLGFDERDQLSNELVKVTHAYQKAGEDDPMAQRELRAKVAEIRGKLLSLGANTDRDELELNWHTFFPHVFRDPAKRGFDVVIANPPYIRVQNIDSTVKEKYRKDWPTIGEGNADLCFAFIELALKSLAAPDGGQISFIQPNFRHHDAGQRIRDLLVGKNANVPARLRLWVDFGDSQVFPTASNYVAILLAERTQTATPMSRFEYTNPAPGSWYDRQDLDWLTPGGKRHEHPAEGEWLTIDPAIREQLMQARANSSRRLRDVATIEVGVQTSADDAVYLFAPGTWSELTDGRIQVTRDGAASVLLERAVVRRCVKGSAGDGYALLYPHDVDGQLLPEARLRSEFPLAWAYLLSKRAELEGREKGKFRGPNWYRFGRNQGFAACARPKVIVPAMQKEQRAFLDADGTFAFTASGKGGGGGYAVCPKPGSGVTLADLHLWVTSDWAGLQFRAYGSSQKGGWLGIDQAVLADIPVP